MWRKNVWRWPPPRVAGKVGFPDKRDFFKVGRNLKVIQSLKKRENVKTCIRFSFRDSTKSGVVIFLNQERKAKIPQRGICQNRMFGKMIILMLGKEGIRC